MHPASAAPGRFCNAPAGGAARAPARPPPGADCFLLEAIFEAEVWDFMCAPVSGANEAAVCGCMVDGAREALAGYATSIEEDLASLREGGLVAGSRQEAAVQVCGAGSMREALQQLPEQARALCCERRRGLLCRDHTTRPLPLLCGCCPRACTGTLGREGGAGRPARLF